MKKYILTIFIISFLSCSKKSNPCPKGILTDSLVTSDQDPIPYIKMRSKGIGYGSSNTTYKYSSTGINLFSIITEKDSSYGIYFNTTKTAIGTYSISISDSCSAGSGICTTLNNSDIQNGPQLNTCYKGLASTYTITQNDSIVKGTFDLSFASADGVRTYHVTNGEFVFRK